MNRSVVAVFCLSIAAAGCVGSIGSAGTPGTAGNDPGSGGSSGSGGSDPLPPPPGYEKAFACAKDSPVAAPMRRLAKVQYENSIREFLSTLSSTNLNQLLASVQSELDDMPPDGVDGKLVPFLRNIHDNSLTPEHVNGVLELSARLAELLVAGDAYVKDLVQVCGAGSTRASLGQAACLDTFVSHYAMKALRRPATAAELATYKAAYQTDGLDYLLGKLMVHPRFYYRPDIDGEMVSGTEGQDATYRLNKYELLSRITLLFWNRAPDDALYQMASDPAAELPLAEVLDHVFQSPHAQAGVRAFFSDWLHLDRLPPIKGITSPAFQTLATGESLDVAGNDHLKAMINEVLDLGAYYTLSGGRYEDILTSKYSFARTSDLANLYGVARWDGNDASMVEFASDKPRGGLLTRAAMVMTTSEYTRPIIKGREVMQNVLCDNVPPPPPAVAADAPSFLVRDLSRTTRADTEAAVANEPCNTCHAAFNSFGYATENYDSLGRYRTEETRFAVDAMGKTTATVAGKVPLNTEIVVDDKVLADGIELGEHLAASGRGHTCLVRQVFRYASAREEDEATDGCGLENMRIRLMENGGGVMGLLKATVSTAGFGYRQVQ